ncbi:hypothetical protein PtA15_9A73 [Puccinia triticina]|uniref:Uncharacterized protein n=1 Tax=Puccinia triticina TaxID=208348 RepID=A0ABY7CRV8_9BASI|nr:uncharacterized protein PtA15_9A73 [Puccinia triticina]WAQ87949.1 hypothetical protein PtA15_9A73 [Puccinia triticina]
MSPLETATTILTIRSTAASSLTSLNIAPAQPSSRAQVCRDEQVLSSPSAAVCSHQPPHSVVDLVSLRHPAANLLATGPPSSTTNVPGPPLPLSLAQLTIGQISQPPLLSPRADKLGKLSESPVFSLSAIRQPDGTIIRPRLFSLGPTAAYQPLHLLDAPTTNKSLQP